MRYTRGIGLAALAVSALVAGAVPSVIDVNATNPPGAFYVSLINQNPQTVPPQTWTVLSGWSENTDSDNWHAAGSANIKPKVKCSADWVASVNWVDAADGVGEHKIRFVRLAPSGPNKTGTASYADTPGDDSHNNVWLFTAEVGVPVQVQVWHDGVGNEIVEQAQFKLRCDVS